MKAQTKTQTKARAETQTRAQTKASNGNLENLFVPREETQASRPEHLRQQNANSLLRLLRIHNPCSRADLMRYSGLSAPTVSSAIAYLRQMNLVELLGEGRSTGGRPPTLLRFKSSRAYVVGADLGGTRLRVVLADLNGSIAGQWSAELTSGRRSPAAVCDLVTKGIERVCRQNGTPIGKVCKLVAGAPGITDARTGVVLSAPSLRDWHNVPLKTMLEEKTGIASLVENDTNLAAVGEHWRGIACGVEDFIFIDLRTGVGAGIFLRGQLHRGANWSAGEIGYLASTGALRQRIQVDEAGPLERAIGGAGIETMWQKLLLKDAVRGHLLSLGAAEIFALASEGNAAALKVVAYVARMLADAIASIALVLNPQLVVLGGGVGSHPVLLQATRKLVERNEFARPHVALSTLGTQAEIFGAIHIALSALEGNLLEHAAS